MNHSAASIMPTGSPEPQGTRAGPEMDHPFKKSFLSRLLLPLFLALFILFLPNRAVSSPLLEEARDLVDRGLALGDNSEAEADFYRQAVALDPSYASAHFNLGFVWQYQGKLELAIEAYRRCLTLDPNRAAAHLNLAECLLIARRDAALFEVRGHLNQAMELQQAWPPEKWLKNPTAAQARLLDIERQINQIMNPPRPMELSAEKIGTWLARPRLRPGRGWYEGPRLPLPFFDSGETQLTGRDGPQLLALAQALNSPELQDYSFIIEGHADGRGRAEINLIRAKKRAEAVRNWLVRWGGISSARLSVHYYGEDHPIFPNDGEDNYQGNRRLEIIRR